MPEIDKTYEFKALPPEERARIAIDKLAELERAYFTAQLGFALRKAEMPADASDEEKEALAEERTNALALHKKRLKTASDVYAEVKIAPPAPEPQKASKTSKSTK